MLWGQGPDDLAGGAHDQGAVGYFPAFGDQGVGTNEAVFANSCPVEDNGVDADQGVVADGTSVEHDLVTHGDIFADGQGQPWVSVQDGTVLDVGIFADGDDLVITANHSVEPDADVMFHDYRAQHCRVVGDPVVLAAEFNFSCAKIVDQYPAPSVVCGRSIP